MTVKDGNKWLERVQGIINNTQNIQKACSKNPDIWEKFADLCGVNTSYKDFTYVIIETLVGYKNLMKEKIDNTNIDL